MLAALDPTPTDLDETLPGAATSIRIYRSRLRLAHAARASLLRADRERFDIDLQHLRSKAVG